MGVLPHVAVHTSTTAAGHEPVTCPLVYASTPSASPEHVFTGLWIPLLRGKHKMRLGWFLISMGCGKRTIVTPR